MSNYALDAAGNPVQVSPDQAASAVDAGSFTPVTQQQAQTVQHGADVEKKVNDTYGTVGAAAMGGAHGLTLGGSSVLAKAFGADQEALEGVQGTTAFKLGDVAGMLAPAILSGGATAEARVGLEAAESGSAIGRIFGMTPAGLMGRAGSGMERMAAGFLPEATSLMGKAATSSIRMAAQGATEGAIVNAAHYAADAQIQDKPLSAQALAAASVDGALFGGGIGGALGAAGGLMAGVGDSFVSAASRGGKGELSASIAAKRLGATPERLAELSGKGEGEMSKWLKGQHDLLAEGGASLASDTVTINRVYTAAEKAHGELAEGVLKTLDKEAPGMLPSLERMEARIQTDLSQFTGTGNEGAIGKAFGKVKSDLNAITGVEQNASKVAPTEPLPPQPFAEPPPQAPVMRELQSTGDRYADAQARNAAEKEFFSASNRHKHVELNEYARRAEAHEASEAERYKTEIQQYKEAKGVVEGLPDMIRKNGDGTWENWAKTREQVQELLQKTRGGPAEEVYRATLNAMDDEMGAAMKGAAERAGNPGLADQYAGAKTSQAIAREGRLMSAERRAGELGKSEATITPRDVGTFAGMSAIGHPVSGAAFIATKGIGRLLEERLAPSLAEAAYRNAIGATAAKATQNVQDRIGTAVKSFVNGGRRAASVGYSQVDYSSKAFQKAVDKADELCSMAHQQRIQQMATDLQSAGHPELAMAMLQTNKSGVEYLQHNRVKTNKDKAAGSLMKLPKDRGLSPAASKYLRISMAITNPMSVIDDLNNGTVSTVAVNAFKYVYPDLHKAAVTQVAQELMVMKEKGKFLSSDKMNTLARFAQQPMDPRQDKDFVSAIQQGIAKSKQAPGNQPGQGAAGGQPAQAAYATPLQAAIG